MKSTWFEFYVHNGAQSIKTDVKIADPDLALKNFNRLVDSGQWKAVQVFEITHESKLQGSWRTDAEA